MQSFQSSRVTLITDYVGNESSVVVCAFGGYKGRWRITHRQQECHPEVLTHIALACVVLHICIDFIDNIVVDNELNVDAICNEWYDFRTKWHEIDTTRDQPRENLNTRKIPQKGQVMPQMFLQMNSGEN